MLADARNRRSHFLSATGRMSLVAFARQFSAMARVGEGRYQKTLDEAGLRAIVAEEIAKILRPVAKPLEITAFPRPHVVLVVGVNGSGKTTTIAKLAHLFTEQDYSVMLAAGDTFRAAAIAQLQTWGDRAGVPVISGQDGADAAGLVFDGGSEGN